MLELILSISGKSGLFKLVSRTNNGLIVECIDSTHKKMPIFGDKKVISLANIAMFTDEEEVPLRQVFKNIQTRQEGKLVELDPKTASKEELSAFLNEVLPNFDRDRVYPADMKKLILWYNILVENGFTDFEEPAEETEEA